MVRIFGPYIAAGDCGRWLFGYETGLNPRQCLDACKGVQDQEFALIPIYLLHIIIRNDNFCHQILLHMHSSLLESRE